MERIRKKPSQELYIPASRRIASPNNAQCNSSTQHSDSISSTTEGSRTHEPIASKGTKSPMASRGRGRGRPAMQVYVPRGRRLAEEAVKNKQVETKPDGTGDGDKQTNLSGTCIQSTSELVRPEDLNADASNKAVDSRLEENMSTVSEINNASNTNHIHVVSGDNRHASHNCMTGGAIVGDMTTAVSGNDKTVDEAVTGVDDGTTINMVGSDDVGGDNTTHQVPNITVSDSVASMAEGESTVKELDQSVSGDSTAMSGRDETGNVIDNGLSSTSTDTVPDANSSLPDFTATETECRKPTIVVKENTENTERVQFLQSSEHNRKCDEEGSNCDNVTNTGSAEDEVTNDDIILGNKLSGDNDSQQALVFETTSMDVAESTCISADDVVTESKDLTNSDKVESSPSDVQENSSVVGTSKSTPPDESVGDSTSHSTGVLPHNESAIMPVPTEPSPAMTEPGAKQSKAHGKRVTKATKKEKRKKASKTSNSQVNSPSRPTTVSCSDTKVDRKVEEDSKPCVGPSSNSVTGEEVDDSWDSMFDDAGECLDDNQMKELEAAVGKVKIKKPVIDYLEFAPKDPEIDESEYGHLIEIYNFSPSLKTADIVNILILGAKEFDIKWVDDTHAVGVFSSHTAAQDALLYEHPLIKTRPISEASKVTRQKVKHFSEFMLPSKERPATTAMTARRLVSASLGISTNVSQEQRLKERQQLKTAKEKKREDTKAKISAWDGSIIEEHDSPNTTPVPSAGSAKKKWNGSFGKCAMDEL